MDSWFHVTSQDNPADFISRGQISAEFLINTRKWLKGQSGLVANSESWKVWTITLNEANPELRPMISLVHVRKEFSKDSHRFLRCR